MGIKTDKLLHFLTGYFIATILPIPAYAGLALSAIAGIGKELCDKRGHGTVERADFWYTVAGGVIGAVAIYLK